MSTIEDTRLEKLRTIPLFERLSDEALGEVLGHATEFEAEEDHVLIQPNQPGTGLFILEEGTVTVDLFGKTKELKPGEFFGELALLREDQIHTARVCTSSHVKCLAIRRDDFDKLLEKEPTIAVAMLKTVAKRLAERA
jgi:CRP-like cAMP-binding protein